MIYHFANVRFCCGIDFEIDGLQTWVFKNDLECLPQEWSQMQDIFKWYVTNFVDLLALSSPKAPNTWSYDFAGTETP